MTVPDKSATASHARITGAAPPGARDEVAAAEAVRQMFTSIAPRYDLLNHVLSMNVDRLWWNRTARVFSEVLRRRGAQVLDLCCGTGDMAFALHRRSSMSTASAQIIGADFSHAMLVLAQQKSKGRDLYDALHLPFATGRFQLVTSAFGFRNLANYDCGLAEIYRVLAANGEVGILDFGEPKGPLGKLYRVYFRRVLPTIGTLISGVRGPYAYLPARRCWSACAPSASAMFPGGRTRLELQGCIAGRSRLRRDNRLMRLCQ
jgi:demethylmenaquinone methyltransferase/2-methoxy-6-polyprenyl-1,4-benzoquinol methylase